MSAGRTVPASERAIERRLDELLERDRELAIARKPAVFQHDQPIAALERVADAIRQAFIDLRNAAEDRRVHAGDVGDVIAQVVSAMAEAGSTEAEARQADVQALVVGICRSGRERIR